LELSLPVVFKITYLPKAAVLVSDISWVMFRIALIVDGTFSTVLWKRLMVFVLSIIIRSPTKFLREKSFGWGKTKMIAFWESPWQNFLVLDADTNVWGNILNTGIFPI
jgi:hypothetical protein